MTIRRTPAGAQASAPSLLEGLSYLAWHPRQRSGTIPARRGDPDLGWPQSEWAVVEPLLAGANWTVTVQVLRLPDPSR